jgi:hypothetical protein
VSRDTACPQLGGFCRSLTPRFCSQLAQSLPLIAPPVIGIRERHPRSYLAINP